MSIKNVASTVFSFATVGVGFLLGYLSNRMTDDDINEMVQEVLDNSEIKTMVLSNIEAVRLYQLHATLMLQVLDDHLSRSETKLDDEDQAVVDQIRLHYSNETMH